MSCNTSFQAEGDDAWADFASTGSGTITEMLITGLTNGPAMMCEWQRVTRQDVQQSIQALNLKLPGHNQMPQKFKLERGRQ